VRSRGILINLSAPFNLSLNDARVLSGFVIPEEQNLNSEIINTMKEWIPNYPIFDDEKENQIHSELFSLFENFDYLSHGASSKFEAQCLQSLQLNDLQRDYVMMTLCQLSNSLSELKYEYPFYEDTCSSSSRTSAGPSPAPPPRNRTSRRRAMSS
jgi:hypothetical protein